MSAILDQLSNIDARRLDPVVQAVLGDETAIVADQHACQSVAGLSHGAGTMEIARLSGNANTATGPKPWSVVVKAMEDTETVGLLGTPTLETEVYQSNVFDTRATGMRSARCYRVDRPSPDQMWLWIEDLSGCKGPPWDADDYARACRDVGRFSGYWSSRDVPSIRGLTDHVGIDRFTWDYIGNVADADSASELDDLMRGVIKPATYSTARMLERAVSAARGVIRDEPRVLVHGDCHPRNLFLSPGDSSPRETVAVDWSATGFGPIANDVGTLVGSGMSWSESEFRMVLSEESRFFEEFTEGLVLGGWVGRSETLRLNYLAMICGYGMYFSVIAAIIGDGRSLQNFFVQRVGESDIDRAFQAYSDRAESLEPLADELLTLAN